MKRMKKFWTDAESNELWQRWHQGQTLREIGDALGRASPTIHWQIAEKGGIAPRARTRFASQLGQTEREDISRGLVAGLSFRALAMQLGRSTSTISREVGRNGGREKYRAIQAEKAAWDRAKRPKSCVLASNEALRDEVAGKLQQLWSPQQIAGWLKRVYENEAAMQVSHETIYRSLFIQARGALKKELTQYLRTKRQLRRTLEIPPNNCGQIVDAVSIRERPAEVEDRAVPGHWEGDLIVGKNNSYVATLVERHTRYVMLVKVPRKDSETVVEALVQQMHLLPKHLAQTLTWDRGTELAHHAVFTMATDMPVYFCDPRSPWQRGSNENTNGLLRQYMPKDQDISIYEQWELDEMARSLNTRPRKTLGFYSPAERYNEAVAATG